MGYILESHFLMTLRLPLVGAEVRDLFLIKKLLFSSGFCLVLVAVF